MNYFLDTNICIHYLNGDSEPVKNRLQTCDLQSLKLPSIVAAELYYVASKSAKKQFNLQRFAEFISIFDIVSLNEHSARLYGDIRAKLETKGKIIGGNDLLIAAIVLENDGILATNNVREFSRVEGLKIEDWTKE